MTLTRYATVLINPAGGVDIVPGLHATAEDAETHCGYCREHYRGAIVAAVGKCTIEVNAPQDAGELEGD